MITPLPQPGSAAFIALLRTMFGGSNVITDQDLLGPEAGTAAPVPVTAAWPRRQKTGYPHRPDKAEICSELLIATIGLDIFSRAQIQQIILAATCSEERRQERADDAKWEAEN